MLTKPRRINEKKTTLERVCSLNVSDIVVFPSSSSGLIRMKEDWSRFSTSNLARFSEEKYVSRLYDKARIWNTFEIKRRFATNSDFFISLQPHVFDL